MKKNNGLYVKKVSTIDEEIATVAAFLGCFAEEAGNLSKARISFSIAKRRNPRDTMYRRNFKRLDRLLRRGPKKGL